MNHKIKLLGLFVDDTQTAQINRHTDNNSALYPVCPLAVLDEHSPAAEDLVAQFTALWNSASEHGQSPKPLHLGAEQQSGAWIIRTITHPVLAKLKKEWAPYFKLVPINTTTETLWTIPSFTFVTGIHTDSEPPQPTPWSALERICHVFYLSVMTLEANMTDSAAYFRWRLEQPVWFSCRIASKCSDHI